MDVGVILPCCVDGDYLFGNPKITRGVNIIERLPEQQRIVREVYRGGVENNLNAKWNKTTPHTI